MSVENEVEDLEQTIEILPEKLPEESPRTENTGAFLEEMRKQISEGVFELQIKNPIRSGKKEIKTLRFDLSKLNTRAMIECERQWEYQFGRTTAIPSHASTYLLTIAAKALEMPIDDLIDNLSMKESIAVCNCVTGFLMS